MYMPGPSSEVAECTPAVVGTNVHEHDVARKKKSEATNHIPVDESIALRLYGCYQRARHIIVLLLDISKNPKNLGQT